MAHGEDHKGTLTEVPGRMNKLAINLQKLKIFRHTKRRPMPANRAVTGSFQGSSTRAVIFAS